MHDHLEDLRTTARAVVAPHLATDSVPDAALDRTLWDGLEKLGLIGIAAGEAVGGSGGDLLDAATVLGEIRSARVPYAEAALVAVPALDAAGIDVPTGPFTAAATADDAAAEHTVLVEDGRLRGTVSRVPWARDCDHLVLLVTGERPRLYVVPLGAEGVEIEPGTNLVGEPRDTVVLRDVVPTALADLDPADAAAWRLRAPVSRVVAAGGVAQAIVELTRDHVSTRVQFGRPLVRFQAVQHAVAGMAARAAAVHVAGQAAVMALLTDPGSAELVVAAAKVEAAALSRPLAAAAHQAHGAIGFTHEHALGSLTNRLLAWREEHGNERTWSDRLGELTAGADLWSLVTATDRPKEDA